MCYGLWRGGGRVCRLFATHLTTAHHFTLPHQPVSLFQPLDTHFFHHWHTKTLQFIEDAQPTTGHASPQQIIGASTRAWHEMFSHDAEGRPIANRSVIKGFSEAGLVPLDRHAISEAFFKPAEAAGKALAAARARLGQLNPSPAEAQALIDQVSPLAPAIPVDLAKAAQIAKRSRKKTSVILTGTAVRQRAAAVILAAAAEEAEKAQRRELRLATRAAKAAEKAAVAVARDANKAAKASRPVLSKRTQKPLAAAETAPVVRDGSVADPVTGKKRRAEAPALVAPADAPAVAPQVILKRVRLVLHKPE